VDFLLALIELFPLGVTAEALRAIIGSKSAILLQRGLVDPKFQVVGVAPHQPFFSENKAKCSFIWYINLDRSFYHFVTIHACDRRKEFSSLDRVCIPCSAVKMADTDRTLPRSKTNVLDTSRNLSKNTVVSLNSYQSRVQAKVTCFVHCVDLISALRMAVART